MGLSWSDWPGTAGLEQQWADFKAKCNTKAQDLGSPLMCPNTPYFLSLPVDEQNQLWSLNRKLMDSYMIVRQNIINICGAQSKSSADQETLFQAVWPTFYWMYNSTDGKRMVDDFLSKEPGLSLPQAAKDTIKNNFNDDVQRKYCILNSTAMLEYTTSVSGGALDQKYWDLMKIVPKNTIRETADRSFWNLQSPSGYPIVRDPYANRWNDPGSIGNPFWSTTDRMAAVRRAMPVNSSGTNFLDAWNQIYIDTGVFKPGTTYEQNFAANYTAGTKGAYYDDPMYGGMMPKMVIPFNPGNAPAEEKQDGGAGSTWTNPCDAKSGLETIIPVAAAVFGAGAVYVVLGRSTATHVAAITAGSSMYYMAKASYGFDALTSLGNTTNSDTAGTIVSVGAPAALVLLVSEYGIDLKMDPKLAAAGAALIGYVALRGAIQTSLAVGGGFSSIITAPIALIDKGLTLATNGCLAQAFLAPWQCTCDKADKTGGKSVIRDAWLDDIYGVTGQQRKLRSACLDAEMRRAGWASTDPKEPNVVSRCNGVTMDNPFACYTAATWAYRAPAVPSRPRTDKQEIDMWNQVSHCLDAGNPSFLPPQNDADRACQRQYGEQFRATSDGQCRNWALPGPNNTDPIGLQYPGAVKPATDSCTIL